MKIEQDQAHISAGVRWGLTLGSPITLTIQEPGLGELAADDVRRPAARRRRRPRRSRARGRGMPTSRAP